MRRFGDRSIKEKLLVAMVATSATALCIASAILVSADLLALRQSMIRNATVLADALGLNSTAALSFQNAEDAEGTLSALKVEDHIVAAALYDRAGRLFASYSRAGAQVSLPSPPEADGARFAAGALTVVRPVLLGDKRIGTILLRSDLRELRDRFRLFVYVIVLVILGSLAVTLWMTGRYQRLIAAPIIELTGTARSITERRDYAVRATRRSADEIGTLTEAFNAMLNSIQERETALRALHATLEQRVAERTAAAEDANRAKSQFLANMSHELRTPLNSVIGFTNLLLKNKTGNLSAEDINFLERILANGRHLLGLINQILDLSKIEAHRLELQLVRVDVAALVRETLAQQEAPAREKGLRLALELPAATAPIQTDPDKLRQVLINLVGNAIKFTERGSITVRVVTRAESLLPLRIEVEDTGIGIPRDKHDAIFDAFRQADGGISRKFGGTGLGLTISRALCQLLGFTLRLRSEPGKGSVFIIGLDGAPPSAP